MTTPVAPARRRTARRALGVVTAVLAPVALAGVAAVATVHGSATTEAAPAAATRYELRAPFVARPIDPTKARDLQTYRARSTAKATTYAAACGTPVVAAHPGIARVMSARWAGPAMVRVASTSGSIYTAYGYMRKASVVDGQLIQSGQQIGEVGREGNATRCSLQFRVRSNYGRTAYNPTTWLDRYVGQVVPSRGLYGDPGFTSATFNILGASHTAPGGNKASWPGYAWRMARQLEMLDAAQVDVVGFQEMQRTQRSLFLEKAGATYGIYPSSATADPENSIAWRLSKFTLLEGATFPVPYFDGRIRQMPYVLLQDNVTGRTAYFINVHNPASTTRYPNQSKWRTEALRRERELVISLRANGRPVFLTGDFNDREKAFCPMTTGKLMISPDSLPSMTCAYPPKYYWVDWIFAAGQARFTSLGVDTSTKPKRISDHPLVVARTHLAD
jgi:endonuclease/exonuclease/phosphatase family metal-dependent hydrolase